MDLKQIFFILSVLVGFVSQGIGIYSIFKGIYKPQRMTRFLYFLMNLIFIGTLIAQVSWGALGLVGAQTVGSIIILLLSIKHGMGGTSRSDIVVLIGATISFAAWQLTSNPTLGLILSIITDLIAFFPTYLKIWSNPETEDWRFYTSDVFAGTFSLLALRRYMLGDFAFPAYLLLLNLSGVILILLRAKALNRKI
jgi:hypothetical protein